MSFDYTTLITDRAASDSDALNALLSRPMSQWTEAEAAAFRAAALKGGYDYTDLNRVSACMEDLVARLNGAGYSVPGYARVEIDRAVTPTSRLPEGYTEVAYIQSSGTQYVDTGFKPTAENMKVCFDFEWISKGDTSLYGSQQTSASSFSITAYNQPAFYVGTSQGVRSQTTEIGVRYQLDAHANNGNFTVLLNGTVESAGYSGTLLKTLSLALFGNNINGTTQQLSSVKLYSCQIYDNGTLVRDYVPCINADNAVGLYDLVNSQFYGNAGTGTFTAGDAVEYDTSDSDAEALDPYTWYMTDAPTEMQLAQYRANVAAVRAVLALPEAAGDVPDSLLTTEDANRLETVLWYVDYILTKLPAARRHCGVSVCGGKGVIT